jgi:hypothetical protein
LNPLRRLDYILKKFKLGPSCKFMPVITSRIGKILTSGERLAVTLTRQKKSRKRKSDTWGEMPKSEQ